MLSNKKFNPIVTKIFIRDRNLNIPFFFAEKYLIKLYALFYYKSSNQTRFSTNCI